MTINDLIDICNASEKAICFNTLGYVKYHCNLNTLINFNDGINGLIINVSRFNEKYGEGLLKIM
jgi:hypothetical protein